MALRDISRIASNRTLMTFVISSIVAVVCGIYWTISQGVVENDQRELLIIDAQIIKSELSQVKAQIAEELEKPDNLTLVNPSNITVVVPNPPTIMPENGQVAGLWGIPIVINK